MPLVAPLPTDEAARLRTLHELGILDTPPDPVLEAIVDEARAVCRTSMSLVTLIDRDRQWFKARRGVDVDSTSRNDSFCAHAIAGPVRRGHGPFVIPDALVDPRFASNPFVVGAPHVRSYAGAPIRTAAGHALGTLCVLDSEPRVLTDGQLAALSVLSSEAASVIELRHLLGALASLVDEHDRASQVLRDAESVLREATMRGRLLTAVLEGAPDSEDRTSPAGLAPGATGALVSAVRTAGARPILSGALPDDLSATAIAALSSCAVAVARLPEAQADGLYIDVTSGPSDVTITLSVIGRREFPRGAVAEWRVRMASVHGWVGAGTGDPLSAELWLPRPPHAGPGTG